MRHFVVGQILLFVLGGIIEAMAELFAQKWREFPAPEFSAAIRKFDRTAEVRQHEGSARETLARRGKRRNERAPQWNKRAYGLWKKI